MKFTLTHLIFIENIPEQFQTFNFNKFEDEFIQENFFYNYRVIEIDPRRFK